MYDLLGRIKAFFERIALSENNNLIQKLVCYFLVGTNSVANCCLDIRLVVRCDAIIEAG